MPHKHRLAVGIDLGTTNSLVATVRNGVADTLPDQTGQHLLPSVVYFKENNVPIVGSEAKANSIAEPYNTISSVKRLIGRSLDEVKQSGSLISYQFAATKSAVPRIKTEAGEVSAIEVFAEILNALHLRAEATLGGELEGCVITVPAYFDDAQRQATKDAAKLANLNVLRLISEPTAAAVAYGLDRQAEGIHVVYDLGGGTFDISILRLNQGVFEVMATAGNTSLGGDDIDNVIAHWILQQARIGQTSEQQLLRQVTNEACRAKEALSERDLVELMVELPGSAKWNGMLTRSQFDELIKPLIQKTIIPCRRALRDSGLDVNDITDIIMVGGSTRIPLVRQMVGDFFHREPLVDIDPDRVVAIGAAIQADVLVGNKPDDEMLLLDVIPLSLGIETMGGLAEKIIPRNTTIPVARAQDFTTCKDGQTAISIHAVQGERELVSDCRSLAKFELCGIPPMVAGAARIRVTYQVDADGLLSVTATEQTTGVESSVQVKPSYGLEDKEIEQMLKDSILYAKEDVEARNLREQQVEASRVVEALEAALLADGDTLLSTEERDMLRSGLTSLQGIAESNDCRGIKKAIKELNDASAEFATRRMDASIKSAMAGHNVKEFT